MTSSLSRCTLTGIDDATSLRQLCELSLRYPFVEWGILYSPRWQGTGRYPSIAKIHEFLTALPPDISIALHVCGRGVPDLIDNEPVVSDLVSRLADIRRVQLNFNISHAKVSITDLVDFMSRFPDRQFISQYNRANESAWTKLLAVGNCSPLFDGPGGLGVLPNAWPGPLEGKFCGYAGGLGPLTLGNQLVVIDDVADGKGYWIDMEASLRTADDRFSIASAVAVLEIANDFYF